MKKKSHSKKDNNSQKGFTLIELLAIIVIITLVTGIASTSIINIINNSKKESIAIANENLKTAAKNYTHENKNIVWDMPDGYTTNTAVTCITINDLINDGYLDEKILENEEIKNITHIIVEKNIETHVITSEYFDNNNTCSNNYTYVAIPKCNDNLTYNGTNQTLINDSSTEYTIEESENLKKNAGTYNVKVSLTDNKKYAWSNGSLEPITKKCKINKAPTKISLNPTSMLNNTSNEYQFTATPGLINPGITINDSKGKMTTTTSNKEYVKVKDISNKKPTFDEKVNIKLIAQSEREKITEIKVTFTPNDPNFEKSEAIFKLASKDITKTHKIELIVNEAEGEVLGYPSTFDIIHGEEYGSNLVLPETHNGYPKKTGYDFIGWYEENGTKAKSNTDKVTLPHSLYAKWKASEYKVYFDANGGTVSPSHKTVTYNEKYETLPTPTKTGYTFNGWYTATSNGTQVTKDTIVKITENQTLHAKWTPNTYQVHYNGNGNKGENYTNPDKCNDEGQCGLNRYTTGSKVENNTFIHTTNHKYGTSWNLVKNRFTKTGYKFTGWATSSTGDVVYSQQQSVKNLSTKNKDIITLYAKWTAKSYTVTLDNQSATTAGSTSVTATYDSAMPTITVPSRTYTVTFNGNGNGDSDTTATSTYTFGGYYTETKGSGTQYYKTDGKSANNWDKTTDTTLYAQWTPQSVTLPTPTRTGYTFAGWYDAISDGTKIGDAGNSYTPTKNITLYAIWTPNTYQVHYNGNGNTEENYTNPDKCNDEGQCGLNRYTTGSKVKNNIFIHTTNHKYDTSWKLIYNRFTKKGYKFAGWATSSTGDVVYSQQQSVKNLSATNKDIITLYAKWTAKSYTVTLDNQSATTAGSTSVTATYDSAMPTITVPSRTYTVTFNGNGNGDSDTKATSTYTFGGYYTETEGTGTQYYEADGKSAKNWDKTADTTLYAQWTPQSITLPTPTRSGYIFEGWYDAASNGTKIGKGGETYTPKQNITLYAIWTLNTYTVTLDNQGATIAGTTSVTATYGSAMPTITVPQRKYTVTYNYNGNGQSNTSATATYTFGGYYAQTNGSGTQYYKTDGKSANNWDQSNDATISAKWTSQSVTLPTPTRTGYTFAGWYTTASTGGTSIGAGGKTYTPTKNIILYARWSIAPLKFTYKKIASTTIEYTVSGPLLNGVCKIHDNTTSGTTYSYVGKSEFYNAYIYMRDKKENKCYINNTDRVQCKYSASYNGNIMGNNTTSFTCASIYSYNLMSICAQTSTSKYGCIRYDISTMKTNDTKNETVTPK